VRAAPQNSSNTRPYLPTVIVFVDDDFRQIFHLYHLICRRWHKRRNTSRWGSEILGCFQELDLGAVATSLRPWWWCCTIHCRRCKFTIDTNAPTTLKVYSSVTLYLSTVAGKHRRSKSAIHGFKIWVVFRKWMDVVSPVMCDVVPSVDTR
jgi:hypothetical protein